MILFQKKLASITAIFAVVIFLPSILWSQWFPLDMGGMFEIGALFEEKFSWVISPYNGSGRYFPIYWIVNSIQFFFFKTNVFPYYVVQSLLLTAAIALSCALAIRLIGKVRHIFLLAAILFLNTPLAENSSTLGKAEPLIYILSIALLLIFVKAASTSQGLNQKNLACICGLFVVALLTKETSLIIIGFAAVGLTLTFVGEKLLNLRFGISAKQYVKLLFSLAVGWCLTRIPYIIFWNPADVPTYLQFDITKALVRANLKFYVTQQPDVFIFGALAGVLLAIHLLVASRSSTTSTAHTNSKLVVVMSLYAMGIAYYLALIVWRWPMAYYMLIPSAIFKIVTIYGIYQLSANTKHARLRVVSLVASYSLIAACCAYSAAYMYYVIGSQISYSRLYTQALTEYVKRSGGSGALVMENHPFFAEQVSGTEKLFEFALDKKIKMSGIADLIDESANNSEIANLLGITQERMKANIKSLPKQGDYLLIFTGRKVATWFLRGVTPFIYEQSLIMKSGAYDLEQVAKNTINFAAVFPNVWTGKIEKENTHLGFTLYKVLNNEAKFFWQGRFSDGWISEKGNLLLSRDFGNNAVLKLSSPSFTIPNGVSITKNGQLYKRIEITNTDEITVQLDAASSEKINYELTVDRTTVPSRIGLNADARALGILVRLEK